MFLIIVHCQCCQLVFCSLGTTFFPSHASVLDSHCQLSWPAQAASIAPDVKARRACLQASNKEETDPSGSPPKKESKELKPKQKPVKKAPAAKTASVASDTPGSADTGNCTRMYADTMLEIGCLQMT